MGNLGVEPVRALLTSEDLSYVAGIVDLLGLIRTRMAGETELPMIQIHGNYPDVLSYLGRITGTKAIVTRRSYSKAGCAEHCKEKHRHIVSVSGRWSLTGARATVVLWNIRPYVRSDSTEAAIQTVMAVGLQAPYKPKVLEDMRERGWSLPSWNLWGNPDPGRNLASRPVRVVGS